MRVGEKGAVDNHILDSPQPPVSICTKDLQLMPWSYFVHQDNGLNARRVVEKEGKKRKRGKSGWEKSLLFLRFSDPHTHRTPMRDSKEQRSSV